MRRTEVLCGASFTVRGSSLAMFSMTSANLSNDSLLSLSVGSIISASSTSEGKYTVGAIIPWSSSRLATSSALMPFSSLSFLADSTNSCFRSVLNGISYVGTRRLLR